MRLRTLTAPDRVVEVPGWVPPLVALELVGGGVAALLAGPGQAGSVVVVALVVAAVTACWTRPDRLAWIAGFVLPIELLDSVPLSRLEAVSIILVGVVAVRSRHRLRGPVARLVVTLGVLLLALVLARLVFSVFNDPVAPTLKYVGFASAGIVAATLIALCTRVHRALLLGYLAGVTLSAAIALLQATGRNWLRTANVGMDRYPGLAREVPALSWHAAVALMIGATLLATSRPGLLRRTTVVQMAVCGAGLIVCGAQGGLAGLAFAAAVYIWFARQAMDTGTLVRRTVLILVLLGAAAALFANTALGATSVSGLAGDSEKGFANEIARVDSLEYGVEQLADAPLTGLGVSAYSQQYPLQPHFLPLAAGVNGGIVGVAIGSGLVLFLGWLVARGPATLAPSAMLGLGILSTMVVHTLVTPSGPFADVERLSMLMVAVVALKGASVPFERVDERGPTPWPPSEAATSDSTL